MVKLVEKYTQYNSILIKINFLDLFLILPITLLVKHLLAPATINYSINEMKNKKSRVDQ